MTDKQVSVNTEQVIAKFRALYPTEFKHVVAEVRADELQRMLSEYEGESDDSSTE